MDAPRRHTRAHLLGHAIATAWAAMVVVLTFAGVVLAFAALQAVLR